MKRIRLAILFVFLVAMLSSCGRNIPLEDLTISLVLGIDLDRNNLIFSESSPVFNKDVKKNTETYQVKAKTIRESRKYFDALTTGEVTAAKIQVLLLGKRVLEHEDWFTILDTMYRNPTFSINTKVLMVDGPVSEIIFYEPDNKPQLSLHLNEVVDKNMDRTRTVNGTLQMLHRQMYEKGMTPSIPTIKKVKELDLVGVTLLDEKGKYIDTLGVQDSSLLLVLSDKKQKELTFTIPLTSLDKEGGIFHKNEVSLDVNRIKTKVKTTYDQGRFHFNYKINMSVNIVERILPLDKTNKNELKEMLEKELLSRLEDLIKKIQKDKIDPIGLGLHARAYQYEQFKKVEEQWGEALAESDIDVSLDIKIEAMGSTK